MKVLIRVPCYNHAKYVAATLASIAEQDYPSTEVIVIDDGSTDDTARIASEACLKYGFRFLRNERNLGLPATLNKMAALSGGFDAVFSIASDDIMPPGAVRSLAEALIRNPGAVGAYGDVELINSDGFTLGLMRNDKVSGDLFERVFCGEATIPLAWIMWTKEAYRAFGGYDEAMPLEDGYAFAKMAKLGTIHYANAPTVRYRKHVGNTTANSWKIYQDSRRLLASLSGETFYFKLRRIQGSEYFYILSRRHKLEAIRYLPEALFRPFRKQFWAGLMNLAGLGFILDKFIRK
jgi:alpha-1,3-rhamnosyltransferase